MHKGLERVLAPFCGLSAQIKFGRPILYADKLAAGWAMGDPKIRELVDALLASGGLSMDAVVAETLSYEMNSFEGIDRLAMNNEARRHANLREFEHRREAKRDASPPAARISRLAAIEKEKANDNEKPCVEDVEVIEVEAEQTGTDATKKRPSKAAGE